MWKVQRRRTGEEQRGRRCVVQIKREGRDEGMEKYRKKGDRKEEGRRRRGKEEVSDGMWWKGWQRVEEER